MVDITREGIESEIQSYVGKSKVAPTIPTGDLYNEEYFAFVSDGMSVWKAAFRQYNPLYSLERMVEDSLAGYVNDSNYDPAGDRRIPEDSFWRFRDSGSYAESTVLLDRLRQDQSDLAILNASNSTFEEIVASLATPTVLAPLAPLRFLRSSSALNRFVGGGAFTAAIMAPEELLMAEQLQTRDASHAALSLAAAGIIGGSLTGALGGRSFSSLPKGFKRESSFDADGEPVYQAAGAGISPSQARRTAFATMENDALKETGVGLEKLPWNPVIRMLQSENPFVRSLAVGMVDVGGMMQKKVDREIAMDQSVETTFRTTYLTPLLNSIREADTAYLAYRGVVAKPTDVGRSLQMMGQMGKDVVKGRRGYLSQIEFRERVGKAMRNGDADTVTDAASQYVNRAATEYRKLFNKIKDEATAVGLFQRQLQAEIVAAREAGDAAKIADLEAALQRINEQGVTVNTALSYLPRVYRIDKIMANPDAFIQRVANWAITSKGMSRPQAERFANEVLDSVTNSRPYLDLDDATGLDFVVKPGSIKQRTLEIPDNLIDDFLENDVEVLARHHTKSMGMDIEIARKYGSIDMREVLEEMASEWRLIIEGETDAIKRANLAKKADSDINDIRGLRDRLRGTYGASKDPHNITSRFIRGMKSFNALVGMGGAVIASVPDVARTVMVEGVTMTYEKGMRHFFKSNQSIIKKMARDELNAAAVAGDAVLGLRASAFSDISDVFGSRYSFERKLNQSAGVLFIINGLNIWNQTLKEFAGTVTALRMTKHIMQDWNSLSKANKEKFLKNGIDQSMHRRMKAQIDQHGEVVDGEFMPNTASWTDTTARQTFRNALNQNVERIIVTPGAGDRALWTSTEFGSLLTQFKSYGQGSMVRMLTSGLQERDGAFWQGAFLLIGLGAVVNEMKRYQYGIDKDENFQAKLLNAVDRSGILGWFSDVNNAVEKLSDYKMGLGPMTGAEKGQYMPYQAKLSAIGGPGVANFLTASSVASDVLTFNANQKTLNDLKFITPGATLPYLDPIFDGIYGQ